MSDYVSLMVKLSREDVREYLTNFYDEEEIENMDIDDEAREAVHAILSDHFGDYLVIGKNTLVFGDID